MTNQKAKQPPTLGGLLGFVGFITGCVIGWNASQNALAALICGIIIAFLGAAIGNIVQRILIIAISLTLMIGMSYCRSEVIKAIRQNGQQQSQTK